MPKEDTRKGLLMRFNFPLTFLNPLLLVPSLWSVMVFQLLYLSASCFFKFYSAGVLICINCHPSSCLLH